MTDIQILRRKLLLLGFRLYELGNGGYMIKSLDYATLQAGSEAEPLSLSQVKRFAA